MTIETPTLPTELPPPDHSRLLELAQEIRRGHADPANTIYRNADGSPRADRIAASELHLKATLLRAGVTEGAPLTPQQAAQVAWNNQFPLVENPAVEGLIGDLTSKQEAKGVEGMIRAAVALREEMGFASYDALIAQAGGGLPAGKVLSPAHKADPLILKLFAAKAAYNQARERARPR